MQSLADLLRGRPGKRVYDPPADLPLDKTDGTAPPYAFPEGLARQIEEKESDEVSSTLSKYRTGLSEHRTRLSEHRTDLSEHRTDLSGYRTELSEHRTTLSYDRSHLSNERTHLSYVRTGVSLLSFGITLNRFAVFLTQSDGLGTGRISTEARMRSTEYIGLGMAILGTLLLVWSLFRYKSVHEQIMGKAFVPPKTAVIVLTLAVVGLGAATSIILNAVK